MTELYQSNFPYQIDKIVSNPTCLDFIQSFIDYEEFGHFEEVVKKINNMPEMREKYGDNMNKVSRGRRKFNLNLGFYSPGKKSGGEVVKAAEVILFFELSEKRNPKSLKLPENTDSYPKRLTSEITNSKPRRSSVLAPSRWSMETANYTKDLSGIALILPNNITEKSKMIQVYCGYRYGQMMGHGNLQIWKKKDSGWKLSSTKGTWIS